MPPLSPLSRFFNEQSEIFSFFGVFAIFVFRCCFMKFILVTYGLLTLLFWYNIFRLFHEKKLDQQHTLSFFFRFLDGIDFFDVFRM